MRISLLQTHNAAVPEASGSAGLSVAPVPGTRFSPTSPNLWCTAASCRVGNTHLTSGLRSAVSWTHQLYRQVNKEINKQEVQERLEG